MKNEIKRTSHSSYRCEYHVVFAPKYRRKIIYKNLRRDIIEIFKKLCDEMKVEIIEGEACPDHIHLLVTIPPYMSVAQFVGTLKSKSALMIFDRHANLKYKYGDGVLFNKDKTELICYPDGKADKSYQILNSVKNVVNNAFNNCIFLEKITIPNSVIRIGDWTFSGCTSLKNVEIGKGVTTIGYEAFVDCTSLKSITIPKNVTEIEDFAFGYTYEKPKILQFFGIETYGGWDGPEYKIPGFTIYGEKGTEAERYAKDNDFKFIEITETIPGDISGDGVISANDAIVIQRHIAGLETLGADQLENADLNGDGIVDEGDAIAILRIDAGLAS